MGMFEILIIRKCVGLIHVLVVQLSLIYAPLCTVHSLPCLHVQLFYSVWLIQVLLLTCAFIPR